MTIDWSKTLAAFAAMPEVKKMIERARARGIEDGLRAIGLAARPSMLAPAIGLFTVGAACGAAAALLLAPRSGESMRRELGELARSYRDKVGERVAAMKESRAERRSANGHSAANA